MVYHVDKVFYLANTWSLGVIHRVCTPRSRAPRFVLSLNTILSLRCDRLPNYSVFRRLHLRASKCKMTIVKRLNLYEDKTRSIWAKFQFSASPQTLPVIELKDADRSMWFRQYWRPTHRFSQDMFSVDCENVNWNWSRGIAKRPKTKLPDKTTPFSCFWRTSSLEYIERTPIDECYWIDTLTPKFLRRCFEYHNWHALEG